MAYSEAVRPLDVSLGIQGVVMTTTPEPHAHCAFLDHGLSPIRVEKGVKATRPIAEPTWIHRKRNEMQGSGPHLTVRNQSRQSAPAW